MAQFPGLMLWTGAWVADTIHLRGPIGRQKRCLYMDLLIKMWRTPGCRVPNDDSWLAEHLFLTLEEVVELLRPVISEFCQTDGNWIFQKRLQKEFVRAFNRSHAASVRAKRRWENDKGLYAGNADTAMHLSKSKIHSSFPLPRATGVDNSEPDEPPQEVADKKETKITAELIQLEARRASKDE